MPGYRPPMYGARRGRKPPAQAPAVPATPAPVAETAEEARAKAEKEYKKTVRKAAKSVPAAKKTAKKKAASKKAAPKKAAKKAAKPKVKKLKRWRKSDTKDDLYWLGQTLGIDKIKSRTPKADMIKLLRRHPGAEEIKD